MLRKADELMPHLAQRTSSPESLGFSTSPRKVLNENSFTGSGARNRDSSVLSLSDTAEKTEREKKTVVGGGESVL